MMDLVLSVFELNNAAYREVPKLDFKYEEKQTGVFWHISAGGSRGYTIRYGENLSTNEETSIGNQNTDSAFMISRVQYALLLSGQGLFQVRPTGRVFFKGIQEHPNWFTQTNLRTSEAKELDKGFYDWLKAIIMHTILRRAAADAHNALSNPHEAGFFVYRGLEWLVVGEKRDWDDLVPDLCMTKSQIRDFKKLANVDYGVRHASRSGVKLRANSENCLMWVCALFDAINATRSRLEDGYKVAPPKVVSDAVLAAAPIEPYC